eukprot:TRINITY_DN22173_c0_g4_i1.p1 TRINITY_DN22173_c0_g4~~TRINITY_DN22173_c0_g4_i1.p1  ORF type:complete len:797 (-),score=91.20 TRINITY_DN22173_c0_g4_i1:65-2455(-)
MFSNLVNRTNNSIDFFFTQTYSRNYMAFPTHNFQYVTWRDGLQARYMIEAIFYFFLFVFMYYMLYSLTAYGRKAYEIINMRKNNSNSPSLEELLTIGENLLNMAKMLTRINSLLTILFIVNFRHIVLVWFNIITERTLKAMYAEIGLDFVLNIGIVLYYFNVYTDFSPILDYANNVPLFISKMVDFWDNNTWVVPLFGLYILLIFLRALNTLEVHNVIGPFIEMIKQMVVRVGTFGLLFVILLFFFAMVGAIYLPYSLTEFRSLYRAVITLFQTSVGVFDMNLMYSEFTAEIFTILFVIVFNILLLNLLIAILTQVYTDVSEKADTLYVDNLVVLHQLNAPHPLYSSAIFSYPPLNFIFGIIFLPVLRIISSSQRAKLNEFFLKFEYFLAFLFIITFYIVGEVLLYILCYLKLCAHLLILICSGRDYGVFRRFMNYITFQIIGLALLFPVLVTDTYYFAMHCFLAPGLARFTTVSQEPISKQSFNKLTAFVRDVKKLYREIPWENIRKSLYELCSIDILSSSNLSPRLDESGAITPTGSASGRSKYKNYRNFTIMSLIIKQISMEDDEKLIVDVSTLSMLLENYHFLVKLNKRQSVLLSHNLEEIILRQQSSLMLSPKHNTSLPQTDRSAAGLLSMRAEVLDLSQSEETEIFMKLFLTYSLEKYTNALISFKNLINKHWLAKNALAMGRDIKHTKKSLAQRRREPHKTGSLQFEETKTRRKRVGTDPFQEDSMIKDSQKQGDNASFTMQELDNILHNVDAEGDSKQNSMLIVPKNTIPRTPVSAGVIQDIKIQADE